MKTKTILSLIVLAFATKLSAITYDAGVNGTSAPAGATFSAWGGWLGTKSYGGTTVLGVTQGFAGNEIDSKQSLRVDFAEAQVVTSLNIGLLYDGPEFKDYKEVAVVTANGTDVYKLRAETATTATWWGFAGATVTNLSPAKYLKGGLWEVMNPFGNLHILSLVFTSETSMSNTRADYGINAFTTVNAPDAASTLGLAGIALLGVGLVRRRFAA